MQAARSQSSTAQWLLSVPLTTPRPPHCPRWKHSYFLYRFEKARFSFFCTCTCTGENRIYHGPFRLCARPVPTVLTQIILCSYMCVEAFMIASRNGYPVLPCAPFNAKNPPAANLLWLFYVSKVCLSGEQNTNKAECSPLRKGRGGKEGKHRATLTRWVYF